jgi:hypothetical protein
MNFNKTNGQTFAVGQTVRVRDHGWCDAKGVIQQMGGRAFQALVLRNGGASAVWLPLTSLTVAI